MLRYTFMIKYAASFSYRYSTVFLLLSTKICLVNVKNIYGRTSYMVENNIYKCMSYCKLFYYSGGCFTRFVFNTYMNNALSNYNLNNLHGHFHAYYYYILHLVSLDINTYTTIRLYGLAIRYTCTYTI